MRTNNPSKSSYTIMQGKIKSTLMAIIFFLCIFLSIFLSSCDNVVKIYFTSQQHHIFLNEQTTITPEVVCKPKGKDYALISTNTSILKVSEDGKSIIGLREGSIILKAESNGFSASTRILVFTSSESSIVSTKIDNKVNVHFVSEAGSFASQKLNPGEKASDPSEEYHRGGYTLFGWYEDAEFSVKFDFQNTPINKTITLYALWGIDTPEFIFKTIDEKTYVSGLLYRYLPYMNVALPTHDVAERPVFGVAEYAFAENKNIENLLIPSGYEIIKEGAFSNCLKLDSITIEGEIQNIEKEAFFGNSALKEVTIAGNSLTQIGTSAFEDCIDLLSISLPQSVLQIGPYAFKSCSSLTSFDIPQNLLKIYNEVFMSSGLLAIDLKNVEEIGTQAFWDCKNLASVSGGGKIKELGSYAFGSYLLDFQPYATQWLKEMINDAYVKEYKLLYLGDALVYAYPGNLKLEYYIKETTKVIAGECFADSQGATITFKGITPPAFIGRYAFGGNDSDPGCKSDIIILNGEMENYINSFLVIIEDPIEGKRPSAYSWSTVNRFYKKWTCVDPSMQIYTRKVIKWKDSEYALWEFLETEPLHILIGGYDKTVNPNMPAVLNIKEETDRAANNQMYIVDNVKSYAFNNDDKVETIIMPLYVKKIDDYAFMSLSKCRKIAFRGNYEWDPFDSSIKKNSFNFSLMPTSCKISVPASEFDKYTQHWYYVATVGRIEIDNPQND